jgi:hypothetical protein
MSCNSQLKAVEVRHGAGVQPHSNSTAALVCQNLRIDSFFVAKASLCSSQDLEGLPSESELFRSITEEQVTILENAHRFRTQLLRSRYIGPFSDSSSNRMVSPADLIFRPTNSNNKAAAIP